MDNVKFANIIGGIRDKLDKDGYKTVPLNDNQVFIFDNDTESICTSLEPFIILKLLRQFSDYAF
jgi:hypothetical protein